MRKREGTVTTIERIEEMPAGTIGFEFSGEVTRKEYREVLEPPLEHALEAGAVRLLLQTAPDFEGMGWIAAD